MPKKKVEYHGDDNDINSKYMFYNTLLDISLFTYADGYDQAMMKFDLINLPHRDDWKIYLECGNQPTESKR
tara:strand:+ start:76 stop:288 length:213 start_codon:yes stop_codon:yes gene_type:complete